MSKSYASKIMLSMIALSCTLAGCLSPGDVAEKKQFLLAPSVNVDKAVATKHTLGVRPLVAARPYTLTMLYAGPDGALLPRADVFWAEEPASTVARALRDGLAQSGRFADVGDAADLARPEYILTGELRKFHEDRSATPPVGVVQVRLELRHMRTAEQVWSDTISVNSPIAGASAADLARAIEFATAELAKQVSNAIASVPLP